MKWIVCESKAEMATRAAADGAAQIRAAMDARGEANVVLATGVSQFEVLAGLAKAEDIAWPRVSFFPLDEYLGISASHPASFRRFLWERFFVKLPLPPRAIYFLDGEANPIEECRRLSDIIQRGRIDVAFVGIGENGHLAFNDPPADFETLQPYHVVTLDEACRRQQVGEGWFKTLAAVPTTAITMSIHQILQSFVIIGSVPERRKAEAVYATVSGPVSPHVPASILQQHPATVLYLDRESACLLGR